MLCPTIKMDCCHSCTLVWCHAKVAVYWVGVANQSELNTSPCMQTSDFSGEEQKNTEGELENDTPENSALSLYYQ